MDKFYNRVCYHILSTYKVGNNGGIDTISFGFTEMGRITPVYGFSVLGNEYLLSFNQCVVEDNIDWIKNYIVPLIMNTYCINDRQGREIYKRVKERLLKKIEKSMINICQSQL